MKIIDKLTQGIEIIKKYNADPEMGPGLESGTVFCSVDNDDMKISDEDRAKLEDLHWYVDEEDNSWCLCLWK